LPFSTAGTACHARVIDLGPAPVFVATLAFKEKNSLRTGAQTERSTWMAFAYASASCVELEFRIEFRTPAIQRMADRCRLPYRTFAINRVARHIELRVSDITDVSEMAVDESRGLWGSTPNAHLIWPVPERVQNSPPRLCRVPRCINRQAPAGFDIGGEGKQVSPLWPPARHCHYKLLRDNNDRTHCSATWS